MPVAPTVSASVSSCPFCAAPLAADQRYCLSCGARVAAHRVAWPPAAPPASVRIVHGAARRARRPSPRTAAALVLTTLGVGTMLGSAATGATQAGTPASIIAFAPAATPAATPTPLPQPPPSGAGLADDSVRASATPEPARAPSPPTAAPAPAAQAAAPTPEPAPAATETPTPAPAPEGPPAKHVVVVSLTGHDTTAFDYDSLSPYLAHELPKEGAMLRGYRATEPNTFAEGLSQLAGELSDAARSWKAYIDEPAPCSADPAPGYDPARNPFLGREDCASAEGPLSGLEADFSDTDLAPSFSFVVPDTCHDGREADCPNEAPSGLERTDTWLREWIPTIIGSRAFADDGLLVVLFDGEGLPAATEPPTVGAIMVSRFARRGQQSHEPYDHFSLLRTVAGTFGVKPPGASGGAGVVPFGHDVLRSQDVPNLDTTR